MRRWIWASDNVSVEANCNLSGCELDGLLVPMEKLGLVAFGGGLGWGLGLGVFGGESGGRVGG